METNLQKPQTYFFSDDGLIPNSKYPLLVYKKAFELIEEDGASWLEKTFATNKWTNSWRWGVYPFHHYHSNTHEVLGVFSGWAMLHMGGEGGRLLEVSAGDVLIIPAGVGHKVISHDKDFTVVGAYPNGMEPDLNKGKDGERPGADENIAKVPLPEMDPLFGKEGWLVKIWNEEVV